MLRPYICELLAPNRHPVNARSHAAQITTVWRSEPLLRYGTWLAMGPLLNALLEQKASKAV